MSSSSGSEDVPMVDAEEHLPSAQTNGHKENDQVMENGAGSEEDLNTHKNTNQQSTNSEETKKLESKQATSENRETSDGPTSHQPIEDVTMSDGFPPPTAISKAAKSSDEKSQDIPTVVNGSTVFAASIIGDGRSASAGTPDRQEQGVVKGQPPNILAPTTNGINGHPHSDSILNGVLPSVEVGTKNGHASHATPSDDEINAIRLDKDVLHLRQALREVSHKSAQLILRENWRTFLFDPPDETHVAFILRAGLKNSTSGILQRVLKDDNVFKPPFLEAASQKPAMRKKILEGVTMEELLNVVPRQQLDELVAYQISTVPVKQLASWLSKGKRLGFEEDDIISENHDELIVPNMAPAPQYRQAQEYRPNYMNNGNPPPTAAQMDPLLVEQNRQRELALQRAAAQRQALATPQIPIQGNLGNHPGPLVCNDCRHTFSNFPGYHHHITKKPCTKEQPPGGFKWSCPNCLQGFTTKQGNDYHRLKGVCTATDIVVSTPAIQNPPSVPSNDGLPRRSSSVYVPPPIQGPAQGPPQGPPQSPWVSQQQRPPPPYIPSPYSQQLPQNLPPPSAPVLPPPRQSAPPATQATPQVLTSIEVAIPSPKTDKKIPPKPPLRTPVTAPQAATFHSSTAPPTTRKQAPRKDIRVDPSDLAPDKQAALARDLAELDRKFEEGVAELPADMDPDLKANRIVSLKNANSSRKSQIRKNYGVTLRMRDKDKQHRSSKIAALNTGSSSPSGSANTTPAPMAAPTPVARPKFDGLRGAVMGMNSPLAGSVSGFSPVNSPSISGFSPVNRPSGNSTPPSSGFGILTTKPQYDNERKRRHENLEHERRPGSGAGGYTGGIPANSVLNSGLNGAGSGLAMVEMGSEDASARYNGGGAKEKVKVHVAGARFVSTSPNPGDAVNGGAVNGNATRQGSSERQQIIIDDSEDDEGESSQTLTKKEREGESEG